MNKEIEKLDKQLEKEAQNNKRYFNNINIKGLHKRFDARLHEKYDTPARNKIKEILGDFIKDNPNPYKQDFIIQSETCKYKYLEIQVCSQWVEKKYPHDKVWIFERKSLYDTDTLFLTFNKNLTRGFLFDKGSIQDVKPRRIKKYSREFVYDIPWCKIMKISIHSLDKETIELY